jgi:hypothetical protein
MKTVALAALTLALTSTADLRETLEYEELNTTSRKIIKDEIVRRTEAHLEQLDASRNRPNRSAADRRDPHIGLRETSDTGHVRDRWLDDFDLGPTGEVLVG